MQNFTDYPKNVKMLPNADNLKKSRFLQELDLGEIKLDSWTKFRPNSELD